MKSASGTISIPPSSGKIAWRVVAAGPDGFRLDAEWSASRRQAGGDYLLS